MILLDASVLLAAEQSDEVNHAASVRLLAAGRRIATLDLAVLETANVALRKWGNAGAANRIRLRVFAIERHGKLVRVDEQLAERSQEIAIEHGITVYDAGYVAAAEKVGAELVSCDEADLVGNGLAVLPADALAE